MNYLNFKRKPKINEEFNSKISKTNKNYEILLDEQGAPMSKIYQKSEQDPFWYAFHQRDIENFANLPWSEIIGGKVNQRESYYTDAVPAFLSIDYAQSLGSFTPGMAGETVVDRVATSLFGDVVKGWSEGVSFQAPDIVMAFIAGASLLSLLEDGRRAYGATSVFRLENSYYGKNLVASLGYDYDSIVNDKANFRSRYNIAIAKFNSTVPVPKGLTIAQRWQFLAQYIFSDTSSPIYSTLMGYKCQRYLMYDATTASTGTCLRWLSRPKQKMTADDYFSMIDKLFDALNDDDVRSMFSSLKQSAIKGEMIQLQPLEEDFAVPVVRNDIMATAMHNARFFKTSDANVESYLPADCSTDDEAKFDVVMYQDSKQRLTCQPLITGYSMSNGSTYKFIQSQNEIDELLLDSYDTMISAASVLDITASMTVVGNYRSELSSEGSDGIIQRFDLIPRSEIIISCNMWTNASENQVQDGKASFGAHEVSPFISDSTSIWGLLPIAWMTHVDSHPLIHIMSETGSSGTNLGFVGELDRYTFITKKALTNMHRNSFWRMINIP